MSVQSIVWLNGAWLPAADARISPLDRGFLFGDAVYEVIPVVGRKPLLLESHRARLEASLAAIGIAMPFTAAEFARIVGGLIERNPSASGQMAVYLQISRGTDTTRRRTIPPGLRPTVFGMALPLETESATAGASVITLPDLRWQRCDIKTTSMLANVMMYADVQAQGADEAILLRDGHVTEAIFSSVIVVIGGALLVRPQDHSLLPGTTLAAVRRVAVAIGLECRETLVAVDQLLAADEIWLTGATRDIVPVVQVDGRKIGSGFPGEIWHRVAEAFGAWKQQELEKA